MIFGSIRTMLSGAAFLGMAATSHVSAAIVTYTYTGSVRYGYDRAGLFGSDENLTGDAFRLVETFDLSKAAWRYASDGQQSLQYGGLLNHAPGAASLVVTIGTVSRAIPDLEDFIYSGSTTGKHLDFVKDEDGYEYAGFYVASASMPADYAQPMVLTSADSSFIGNYQYFDTHDAARATYANFDVDTLTVTSGLTPVPLPGGMPLFAFSLVGTGILGHALKRRSRSARDGSALPCQPPPLSGG